MGIIVIEKRCQSLPLQPLSVMSTLNQCGLSEFTGRAPARPFRYPWKAPRLKSQHMTALSDEPNQAFDLPLL